MDDAAMTVRRGRKFDQVLEGAREVFMADGFEGASVDTIARRAGVSKATLYSYFPDKRLLFLEVAQTECARQSATAIEGLDMQAAPETVLRAAGRHMVGFLLSPFGQRVFRICVAETDRFPELGQRFWDSGPGLVERTLTAYLRCAVDRGTLRIDDLRLAAHQFAELCKADLFPKLVFGMQTEFRGDEIDRVVDGAVEMFMARYGV
ncbi:transcriptional regulator, TetR family [Oceaniovalibus guishaninsula JLT2003]|uniref:Transcriptional regulator, TetR family n=1 Tax=Oceaniovalibus guishaninsula JLT2003 TaxID=1231392 RepID=K2H959_9RHOB|nr:TetR/AcrR family transcriptional regulator [Oceaniovalibus guishaninsula]EKE44103.1 transcriptional regulator, TetR family [Oceaniovalibus guishaninsula JLT2003]